MLLPIYFRDFVKAYLYLTFGNFVRKIHRFKDPCCIKALPEYMNPAGRKAN